MRRSLWLVAVTLVAGCSSATQLPPIARTGTAGVAPPVVPVTAVDDDGAVTGDNLGSVTFVPFTRSGG